MCNDNKAIEAFKVVLQLERYIEEEIFVVPHSLTEMAEIYLEQRKFKEASLLFKKAKTEYSKYGINPFSLFLFLLFLFLITKLKDFDKPLIRRIANGEDYITKIEKGIDALYFPLPGKINTLSSQHPSQHPLSSQHPSQHPLSPQHPSQHPLSSQPRKQNPKKEEKIQFYEEEIKLGKEEDKSHHGKEKEEDKLNNNEEEEDKLDDRVEDDKLNNNEEEDDKLDDRVEGDDKLDDKESVTEREKRIIEREEKEDFGEDLEKEFEKLLRISKNEKGDEKYKKLLKKYEKKEIVVELMRSKESGLKIKERSILFKSYQKCFVASEAIDWVLKNIHGLIFSFFLFL